MKSVKLCLPICLLLMSLCACGGPTPVSEAQLQEDLETSEASLLSYYSEQLQASVTGFEVVRQQTIVEDQKDTAWVQISIEGPEVKGNFHYIMSYGLYNDGWQLEGVQQDRESGWRIEPLAGPKVNFPAAFPPGAELISSNVVLDAAEPYATYEYTYTEKYPYCEVTYKKAYDYTFDHSRDGVWCFAGNRDTGTLENWNIDGVWSIGDKNGQFYFALCLDGFSPQGIIGGGIESDYTCKTDGWYRDRFYLGYQKDGTYDGPFDIKAQGGGNYDLPISYRIRCYDNDLDVNYYGVFMSNDPVFGHQTQLNRE